MKNMKSRAMIFLIIVFCLYGQGMVWAEQTPESLNEQTLAEIFAKGPPFNFPLAYVVEDVTPSFQIDPTQPFILGLGRGSGWHGLETVRIQHEGEVEMYREDYVQNADDVWQQRWERGQLHLPKEAIHMVLDALSEYRLMTLHKAYHADVHDGTQWVFFIRQDRAVKSVYCNNHFPEDLMDFAKWLDALLTQHRLDEVVWEIVPQTDRSAHDDEFWALVNRR